MNKFTSKERTKKYITKLKKDLRNYIELVAEQKQKLQEDPEEWEYLYKDHVVGPWFSPNEENHWVLMISPNEIYKPFIDQDWGYGGHVSRKYFRKGLEFLKNQPVKITGESSIDYWNVGKEKDLSIEYYGEIPLPFKVLSIKQGWEKSKEDLPPWIRSEINIPDMEQFNRHIEEEMYVDAYEGKSLIGYYLDLPSYIWLPHPDGLEQFKDLLKGFVPEAKRRRPLEKRLDDYYSQLD